MDETESKTPSPSSLSKTPSWISIGFVLGALFVWFLPKPPPEIIEVPVRDESPPPLVANLEKPKLSEIEAVFGEWERYAVWSNDTTEVALWDIDDSQYSRFYEILKSGNTYYYRSIAGLTRPVLTHGVSTNAPLLFTETEKQREEWLKETNAATWDSITGSIRKMTSEAPSKPEVQQ